MKKEAYSTETQNIRIQSQRSDFGEHSAPIYLTSSFVFDSAEDIENAFNQSSDHTIYSRYSNPNTDELIAKVASMEEMDAGFATSSGMAAVYLSMIPFLNAGDHVLSTNAVFGSTHQLFTQILPRFGVETTYVDPKKPEEWQSSLRPNTKLFFSETPANPSLTLLDLTTAGKFAKSNNLLFIVDNCFATPILQQPVHYGADLVIHSATKFFDGQGRVLGGLILGSEELMEKVVFFARHTGPAMSPFNAWLLSKSLETLSLRMKQHCDNALKVAQALESMPRIKRVLYPHLPSHPQYDLAVEQMSLGGGIVSFELDGGKADIFRFINNVKIPSISSNLGDSRTIITHPATTTHAKVAPDVRNDMGISDQLIRLSVGLESAEDLISDLQSAI